MAAALLAPNYLRSVQPGLYLKVPPAALLLVNSELMFYGSVHSVALSKISGHFSDKN